MKKIYLVAVSLMLAATTNWHANAQMTFTADFKPGPLTIPASDEAVIANTYGCTPMGWSGPGETSNGYGSTQLSMTEWTVYALGCNDLTVKSLIRFDQMCTLPPNAIITYASLSLWGVSPTPPTSVVGNSWYSGTPYSDNPGWVKQITSPWTNTLVTWVTAPSYSTTGDPIPVTTTQWNNNFVIDVTAVTNAIWASGVNYGYWLELQNPNHYRSTLWASSFDANPAKWPELYIEYHLPCDANFTVCSNTNTPNTFNFTAEDGTYPYAYTWDFGDGSPIVTGTSVSHTYTATGSYKVCLTLTDAAGNVMCEQCTPVCVNEIVKPCNNSTSPGAKSSTSIHPFPKNLGLDGTLVITSVSPNPANTVLNVNLQLISAGAVQYTVYDMAGKEVLNGKTSLGSGKQKVSVSVEKLIPGTYIIEMADNYTKTTAKFTKE